VRGSRRARIWALVRHPVAQNAFALYWVQIATFVIPIVTLPYLARVLDPAGLGVLAAAQSLSGVLYLGLEYGFGLSAGRDIARNREDRSRVGAIVAGVVGAEAALALLVVAAGAVATLAIPIFREQPEFGALAVADAIALALNPLWYYRGIERMRMAAAARLLARVAAAAGLFVIVNDPADGWKALALQAGFDLVAGVVCLAVMYRHVPLRVPGAERIRGALREGWSLFLYNAAISMYTTANAFLLGIFVPAAQVGYFNGAERVSRAATRFVGPISEALFPRVSHLLGRGEIDSARRIARRSFMWLVSLGVLGGAILAALAPFVVDVLLGPGYESAVPVLQILSILIPLIAASNVLGLQWMVPLELDRPFVKVVLITGPLNIALLAALGPPFGATGGAVAVVVAEAFVTLGLAVALWRRDLLPIGPRRGSGEPPAVAVPTPTEQQRGDA
jgi:PST family polysaccharide transporter